MIERGTQSDEIQAGPAVLFGQERREHTRIGERLPERSVEPRRIAYLKRPQRGWI